MRGSWLVVPLDRGSHRDGLPGPIHRSKPRLQVPNALSDDMPQHATETLAVTAIGHISVI